MNISINPSYTCNLRCPWCYLTKEQLSDKKRSKLLGLEILLDKINSYKKIVHIDLYGGVIGILPSIFTTTKNPFEKICKSYKPNSKS